MRPERRPRRSALSPSGGRRQPGDGTDTTPKFRGHARPVSAGEPIVPQRDKNGYRVWFDPGEVQRFPNLYGWFMRFVLKFILKLRR
jgi:hypothetical protein